MFRRPFMGLPTGKVPALPILWSTQGPRAQANPQVSPRFPCWNLNT
jgi:hypothetical protein